MDLRTTKVRSDMKSEYFVQWKNALEESGWETKDSLWRWMKEIVEFDAELARITGFIRTIMTRGGGGCQDPELALPPQGELSAQLGTLETS